MNNPAQIRRFICTGTPGSGKTSAIKELEKRGYSVIHEAATDVIAREQAQGIEHPWESLEFVDQIVQLQKERQMNSTGALQFYDRSPFCTYALGTYLSHSQGAQFAPSSKLLDEIDRCLKNDVYHKKVLFFENLGFVEHTDARKISYEEALIFEQIHVKAYQQFGFERLMVPRDLTVQERCEFILERTQTLGPSLRRGHSSRSL